jgi:lactate permease
MWQHNYTPVGGSLALSAPMAALPILVLFVMLGVFRKASWISALTAMASALLVALVVYGMPVQLAITSALFGAAQGVFPIAWVVFAAIMLYRLAVDTGKFEIIKDSIGGLTSDRRLQAMFIAFSFGAFLEGAAGFGAPVAISGAMLAGLGFDPFFAAGICLLANTAPVAFGSIGIPVTTLSTLTGLSALSLSAMVGRLCAMVSVVIPAYMIVVMTGWKRMIEVLPAVIACGVSFAAVQFLVSNFMGPELTDILSSLSCIVVMVLVIKFWKPKTILRLLGDKPIVASPHQHSLGELIEAWVPYLLLVVFVLIVGNPGVKEAINRWTDSLLPAFVPTLPAAAPKTLAQLNRIMMPGLHNLITQMPPVTARPAPYGAVYELNWLSASGTACLLAVIATAIVLRAGFGSVVKVYVDTFKQLKLAVLTIALMLGLASLMNYSGMTSTLGLAMAGTGRIFPFFSATLGWMGVFLTGSDTSANALFGNLQVVTARALSLNPVLTASVNSAAGVMGKMISVQSIAVAVAATGMMREDESRLFRFTIKHSVLLMIVMGIISMMYAYAFPHLVPNG